MVKKTTEFSHSSSPTLWWERLSQLSKPQHGHKNIYKDPQGLQLREPFKNEPGRKPWR